MRNIFPAGGNEPSPTYDSPFGGGMPNIQPPNSREIPYDTVARMQEIYHPETTATDKFNELQAQYPQYENPGKLRKIGGAILGSLTDLGTNLGGNHSGIRGTDVYNETTGRNKFDRDVASWKQKIGPAQASANLERQNNMNERQLATSTVNSELTNRRDDARNKTNEANTQIRADRAKVYEYKAEHPNKKFDFTGPTVKIADPITGEVVDTGIKTGSLSDEDKLNLQQKNAIAKIEKTGEETRKTEGVKETGRETLAGIKGDEARKTKQTSSATLTNKGESPTQTKVRQFNNARAFAAQHPDLAKFIKLGKSNEFSITPPSKGGFFSSAGPTDAQHQIISDAIFGESLQIPQPTRTGVTTPTNLTTPKTESGSIRVRSPSGIVGTFKGTRETAEKAGYTVIK